jgi:hypothetical protein
MLITEFTATPKSNFSINSAVVFHDTLNPKLFTEAGFMHGEVRRALLQIA